jgi:hypothetical protein
MEALPAIIGGRAGGFPGWVNECFAGGRQSRGIERAKIRYEIAPDLGHWGVEIVGKIKAWAKAISGPTARRGVFERDYHIDASPTKVRFAVDSPLEEDGFELAVPPRTEGLREGTSGTMSFST